MEPSPSYERYCRQRKATLDKERYLEQSRSMNEVVEDIFEIISTDEEMHVKTKPESSIITSESSCPTWSLSSSAIVSSNPSISTTYDGDEDLDDIQKQIQSYTSQLFSPLYEVRGDQKNVFQENRQPLPKPGRTPKFRNLCYNLGTHLSFDHIDPIDKREYFVSDHDSSPKSFSPQNQSSHCIQDERLQSNVSPLAVMTTAEVQVRNIATKSNIFAIASPEIDERNDRQEIDYYPSTPPGQKNQELFLTQINQTPLLYDEIYARKDWMLKTASTTDSGVLSLEPLLNAYSEDLEAGEELRGNENEPISFDLVDKNGGPIDLLPISGDLALPLDSASRCVSFKETDFINKEVEKDTKDAMRTSMNLQFPLRITESIVTTNFSLLRQLTLDLPFSPLQYILHKSVRPFDSSISKNDKECSSLVQYEASTEGTMSKISRTRHESSWVRDEYLHSQYSTGCFLIDIESFCTLFSDWENPMASKYALTCGGADQQCGDESNETVGPQRPAKTNEKQMEVAKRDLLTDGYDRIEVTSKTECHVKSHGQGDIMLDEIDAFLRDHDLDSVIEFSKESFDRADLFPSMSKSSCPASFDSEQFSKDMAKRIESDLRYLDVNDCNDETTVSTLFPEISMNLLSSYSYSSDDGLDKEIGALELFEMNLKKEIENANKTARLLPLTSPIQTLLSSRSSNCSINTTFLSEYDASLSYSSENALLHAAKDVRKVHFNEQVEEFLYAANEACWTPDAKASGLTNKTESFVDELYNVLDDILDEINSACISLSSAMDRTKQLSKKGGIRRSSVN